MVCHIIAALLAKMLDKDVSAMIKCTGTRWFFTLPNKAKGIS